MARGTIALPEKAPNFVEGRISDEGYAATHASLRVFVVIEGVDGEVATGSILVVLAKDVVSEHPSVGICLLVG